MKRILVLNMGMKSIRSIIFDSLGNKLASNSIPIETSLTDDRVTQNPNEWWEKACKVIQKTVSDLDDLQIDYLTVTTSSSCLVCVDEYGNPLYPCIMVSDKRALNQSEELSNAKSFETVKKETGLGADAYLLIPKALWIKENETEVWNKTRFLLSPNDFLLSKFTGCFVTDYLNAKKWHYNPYTKQYPDTLLKELGIEKEKLPKVVNPGDYVANVKPEIAQNLGLNNDVKVIASTYDAICSFIGSSAFNEGQAADISGTVTVFRCATQKKIEGYLDKIQYIPYLEGNINIVGGSNNLGGGLIEWVKQCYYINENLPYELMEKEASETSIGAGGLIFLPYLLGERAPIWDNSARGVFFGLERAHTRKEMTRAVFESAGFIDLDMIAAIEEKGIKVNSIMLSGGLARVSLVSQIKADITGKEIQVLSEFETTSTGAAMIALFGQKEFKTLNEAAESFVDVRMVIKPNKKNYEKYQELYRLYKDTYNTLKPLFPKRQEITKKLYGKHKVRIENL